MAIQRKTRQRAAIGDLLEQVDDFRSAQQLHDLLGARGEGIGLATVYRTLQTLADEGQVDVLRSAGGEAVYRRCERRGHHHHLVCRSCGKAVEIEGPSLEAWARSVAEENGFTAVEHTFEVFGTCADCAARGA